MIAGSYVTVGSAVSVNYLGSVCEMDVVRITVENGDVMDADSIADISETMKTLDLLERPTDDLDTTFNRTNTDEFICLSNNCEPRFIRISESSKVILSTNDKEKQVNPIQPVVTLDFVGGLDSQKALLSRLVKLMLNRQNENLADCYGEY